MKKKLYRITTVPYSLNSLLKGQLSFMQKYYEVKAISSGNSGSFESWGRQENIPTYTVELTRKITPIADLMALYKLFRLFRKERPYIVHTHTPKAGTIGMIAAYLAGVPHRLHTIAGLPLMEASGLKRKLLDIVETLTYFCATRIYPNSKGLYDFILEMGYTHKSKLKIIGEGSSNGIDTNHFNPALFDSKSRLELRESLGIDERDFVFLFIGRLVRDKGINELIQVFNELSFKSPNLKLVLVGRSEPDLDPLQENTVEIIKVNSQIITTGDVSDVRPFLAMSDLVVFPSYREGFPNVVMETGAMGKPIIVSDINGCNEIITHGRNGIIIPPKNTDSLKQAMKDLLSDKEKLNALASCARQEITQRFERSYIWQELLKEYRLLEENEISK